MNGLIIICIAISLCIMVLTGFNIVLTTRKNEAMLKAQIEASKIKKTDHINTMKFDDILGVINKLINFYVSEKVLELGLINKNDDEISIVIDNMIVDVSTLVTSSLSDKIIEALLNYVTKDHMQRYIVSTIRLEIVARLATK